MKFLLFAILFQSSVHAGNFLSGVFRPITRHDFILKDPFQNSLNAPEVEVRLSEAERIRLHNIFQRQLGKAGVTDAPEIVGNVCSNGAGCNVQTAPSALAQGVFELPSVAVNNKPSFLLALGGDNGGPGGGPGPSTSAASKPTSTRSTVLSQQHKKPRNLKETKKLIDELLLNSTNIKSLTDAFKHLLSLAYENQLARDLFVEYSQQHPALIQKIAENGSFLSQAVIIRSPDIVQALLQVGCDVNKPDHDDSDHLLPIQHAMAWHNLEIFELLISHPLFNPNSSNNSEQHPSTVLEFAISMGIPIFAASILSHPRFNIHQHNYESSYPTISNRLQVLKNLDYFNQLSETDKAGYYYSLLELGHAEGVQTILEHAEALRQASFSVPVGESSILCLAVNIVMKQYVIAIEQQSNFMARRLLDTLKIVLAYYPNSANAIIRSAASNNELIEFVETLVLHGHIEDSAFDALTELSPAMHSTIEKARRQRYPEYAAAQSAVAESMLMATETYRRDEIDEQTNADISSGFANLALESLKSIGDAETEQWNTLRKEYVTVNGKNRLILEEKEREQRIQAAHLKNQEERRLKAKVQAEKLALELAGEPDKRLEIQSEEDIVFQRLRLEYEEENNALIKGLERRAQMQRAEREARLNARRFSALQEIQDFVEGFWTEYLDIFRTLGNLLHRVAQQPLEKQSLLERGDQSVEQLWFDETLVSPDETRNFLAGPHGRQAFNNVIQNKKIGSLKYLLELFGKLGLDPRNFLSFAIEKFGEKPKKGSEEARIVKLLQESSEPFAQLALQQPQPAQPQTAPYYRNLAEAIREDHVPSVEYFLLHAPQSFHIAIVHHPYGPTVELTPLFYAVLHAAPNVLITLRNEALRLGLPFPAQRLLNYANHQYSYQLTPRQVVVMRLLESWS